MFTFKIETIKMCGKFLMIFFQNGATQLNTCIFVYMFNGFILYLFYVQLQFL